MSLAQQNYRIEQGKLAPARWLASEHFNQRPDVDDVSLLVVHGISLPPNEFGGPYIDQLFTGCLDPDEHEYFQTIHQAKVSAHLLIQRDGQVTQYVNFADRAWHAGVSQYQGQSQCNDFSIGIELEGADHIPYTEQQYQQLSQITIALMHEYPRMSQDRIVGHSDIAPGRKTDPGPAFDWDYFRKLVRA